MPRARKSTLETLEEMFADLPVDQQSWLMDRFALIHRLEKRRARRPDPNEPPDEQGRVSDDERLTVTV